MEGGGVRRKGKEGGDQIRGAWDGLCLGTKTVAYQALYLVFIQQRHGGLLRKGRNRRLLGQRYGATVRRIRGSNSSRTGGGAC